MFTVCIDKTIEGASAGYVLRYVLRLVYFCVRVYSQPTNAKSKMT